MDNEKNSAAPQVHAEKKLGFRKVTVKTGVRAGGDAVPTTTIFRHHTTTAFNCGGGGPGTTAINCP